MNGPLFFELSSCIVGFVFELLAMEQAFQDHQFDGTVALNLSALGIHMCMLVILCHFSEKFTDRSNEVGEMVYSEVFWYKLPIAQQKTLIFVIRRAQQHFRLRGYGIFDCSLEMFLKVSLLMRRIFHGLRKDLIEKILIFSDKSIFNFLFPRHAPTQNVEWWDR